MCYIEYVEVFSSLLSSVTVFRCCIFHYSCFCYCTSINELQLFLFVLTPFDCFSVQLMASTPPRVFRHVATLIGLQLVTSFVTVAKTLGQSRETAQRQLNAEKKKRKEGARIESLNKQLSGKHEKITMVEEMMRRIFTGLVYLCPLLRLSTLGFIKKIVDAMATVCMIPDTCLDVLSWSPMF